MAAVGQGAGRLFLIIAGSGVIAAVGWLVFFGWHHEGDYNPWSNVGYAVLLLAVTAIASWHGFAYGAAAGVSLALGATLMFSLDNGSRPETSDANLWPVGAVMLCVFALAGLFCVSVIVRLVVSARETAES